MDQKKIGLFLKELRKEKRLTQGQLAEHLNMSDRTVSRWETGTTLPDLSVLIELADFYHVDIREIIDGERKSETMNTEMKETLIKAAQYAEEDKQTHLNQMHKIISALISGFGCFLILSAFTVFPSESGWGVKFAILGAILVSIGIFQILSKHRLLISAGILVLLIIGMFFMDFASVCYIRQAPRFSYLTDYNGSAITYHAPFYTVTRQNPETPEEHYQIQIGNTKF